MGRFLHRLAESLGPPLLRLLGSTYRFKVLPPGVEDARRARGDHAVYAFWHGRMLIPAYTHRMKKIAILISRHGDGEYIARVVNRLGFVPIRGSSTRGGVAAMKRVVDMAGRHDLAFTPDGPRGPRYKVQKGVVFAASRTGLPLVPVACEAYPAWVLGSWDEFTIPKPFSRVLMLQGDPIDVPKGIEGEELERVRQRVEDDMHRLMEEARAIVRETRSPAAR